MAHSGTDLKAIFKPQRLDFFGMEISHEKTEVLHQPSHGTTSTLPTISTEGTELKVVDQFKYLGSIISWDGSRDKEISTCINKASQSLGRLRSRVFSHKNVKLKTNIEVYSTVVQSTLLTGCET
ncbi:uncharacterized protein [Diadema setosum]|uniref:uncharacterized protein n=1 Tax=Diadema setosum TaxID=31175 RepID=UPI003B3A2DC1